MTAKKTVCDRCQGRKWYHKTAEDGYAVSEPCVCLKRERAKSFLGPLMRYKHVRSDLWSPEVDRTDENIFIEGTWEATCGHLKWALMGKHRTDPSFTYRIIDDDKIVRVWLGLYSYRSRPQHERETSETYNTVADLVEPPDLLIIRLGVIQRNQAAGDALFEALQQRDRVGKSCWIVEGDIAFTPGHQAYTENGWFYITEHYQHFSVGGDVKQERAHKIASKEKTLEELISKGSVSIDGDMPSPVVFDEYPKVSNKPEIDLDFELPSGGGGRKQKGRKY